MFPHMDNTYEDDTNTFRRQKLREDQSHFIEGNTSRSLRRPRKNKLVINVLCEVKWQLKRFSLALVSRDRRRCWRHRHGRRRLPGDLGDPAEKHTCRSAPDQCQIECGVGAPTPRPCRESVRCQNEAIGIGMLALKSARN